MSCTLCSANKTNNFIDTEFVYKNAQQKYSTVYYYCLHVFYVIKIKTNFAKQICWCDKTITVIYLLVKHCGRI